MNTWTPGALALLRDGCANGITRRDGDCWLLRFDPKREQQELGRLIMDSQSLAI